MSYAECKRDSVSLLDYTAYKMNDADEFSLEGQNLVFHVEEEEWK